jgi:hypothetical protein
MVWGRSPGGWYRCRWSRAPDQWPWLTDAKRLRPAELALVSGLHLSRPKIEVPVTLCEFQVREGALQARPSPQHGPRTPCARKKNTDRNDESGCYNKSEDCGHRSGDGRRSPVADSRPLQFCVLSMSVAFGLPRLY